MSSINLNREVCDCCKGNILIGHRYITCGNCTKIVHKKCYKKSRFAVHNMKEMCPTCICNIPKRYNPFSECCNQAQDNTEDESDHFYNRELHNEIPMLQEANKVLVNCRNCFSNSMSTLVQDTDSDFSTLFYNIDGNKSNFDTFVSELLASTIKFSVIGIAETNVGKNELASLFKMDNYKSFYGEKNSDKSKGSGVALYVHDAFNAIENEKLSITSPDIEALFLTMNINNKKINIGTVYRSPNGDKDKFFEEFNVLIEQFPKNTTSIIMGDFNFDLFKRLESAIENFEDIFLSQGYFPLISLSTHTSPGKNSSCIDNILTNNIENVCLSGVIRDIGKHHSPIFTFLNLNLANSSYKSPMQIQEYSYSSKTIEALNKELNGELIDVYKNLDFDSFFMIFKDSVDQCCKLKKPRYSKRNPINNPWITDGIIDAIEHKNDLYLDWFKSKSNEGDLGNPHLYEKFSKYRYCLKKIIKEQKSRYYRNKIANHSGDLKKIWEVVNQLRGKNKKSIKPNFMVDGVLILQRRVIANKFNEYFTSIATKLNNNKNLNNNSDEFRKYMPPSTINTIFLSECTEDEVSQIINQLQNGKASDFPIKVIKKLSPILTPVLCSQFNNLMANGVFPSILKTGKITPVYKKDDEQLIENYRPVSTLPIFGKIFEKIIYSRLYGFFVSNGTLHKNQFGFRTGHSTSHALNYSIQHIEKAIKEGSHMLGVFIDLSKAFDTIDHGILLKKLHNYGIRGIPLKLIESYLTDRNQYVSILGETSDTLPVIYGVPQGSCLGPLLFLIYINDISKASVRAEFVLFADDTNIFIKAKTKELAYQKANEILQSVNLYMEANKLHINMSKCCFIDFKSPMPHESELELEERKFQLKIHNEKIERVSETKFLGVVIDEKLNWSPHIRKLSKKLACSTGILNTIKNNIPEDLYKDLYHTLFESHLAYGITIWGGVSKNKLWPIFKTQKKCMRILFGDKNAYLNKFKTCARTRPIESQYLGPEFYKREHSKPLFTKHSILNVRNLFIYHSSNEIFKILKFRTPMSMFEIFELSVRNGKETRLLTPEPSSNFFYVGSLIWNVVRNLIEIYDFSIKCSYVKPKIKKELLKIQTEGDPVQWQENSWNSLEYKVYKN